MRHSQGLKCIGVALVATFVLAGCVDRAAQEQSARTQKTLSDPTRPVKVRLVALQPLTETLAVTGAVTTSEDVQVGAKMGARLVAVLVKEGDPVKAGQVIAIQDTSDISARLRQASAQVSAARSQHSQAISNAAIQPSKSTAAVRAAESELRRAKANLSKIRAGARNEEKKQAEAAVTAAESAMVLAKKELDRTIRLADEGAIPRARIDQAQNAYQAAVSQYQNTLQQLSMMNQWARPEDIQMAVEQVRSAEEGVRQAKAQKRLDILLNDQVSAARANLDAAVASLDLIRQTLSDAQIKAPFAGRISGKPAQPGAFLSPGTPVARIVGGSGNYFEGEVPETMISQISAGKGVRVTIDALAGQTIYGSVVAISPLSEEVGRLFKVRVQLGAGIEGLRPGMFARGEIDLRTIPSAVVVPSSAVLESGGESYVYVIEKDAAKKVVVRTGLRKGDLVQVMGLVTGQQVVIEGQTQLAEGAKIKIDDGKAKPVAGTGESDAKPGSTSN